MHTLLPMQLAFLLMVLYIASASLAIIPTGSILALIATIIMYRRNISISIDHCSHGSNTPLHQDLQEKDNQMFPHMGISIHLYR